MKVYLTSKKISYGLYKSIDYFQKSIDNCDDIKYWIIDQNMIKWLKSQNIDYTFNVDNKGYEEYFDRILNKNDISIPVPPTPSIINWAKPHFIFKNASDAVLFKLAWG